MPSKSNPAPNAERMILNDFTKENIEIVPQSLLATFPNLERYKVNNEKDW